MYSPLYIKTDYSLLSSLIKIDNLITYLNKYNITSCAIVDNNLFGTMEIINKFKKNNIKPIIGLEINIFNYPVLLYAKNEMGYKNLIKIETIKNENEIDINVLKEYKNDLICIVFYDNPYFKDLNEIYDDIFIGVGTKNEEYEANKITKKVVFCNKTLYLEKFEYKYLPYIFMIRDGKTISEGIEFIYQNNYLLTYDDIVKEFRVDTINNTLLISDMCNIELTHGTYMPKYEVEDSNKYIVNLARRGLAKRFNDNIPLGYLDRLKFELDIIINMNFSDYFLVVYDFIRFAKKNNILVGPGRGSAAGSLVCFALGITDVDPLKYDLLFERFLNPERISMPDIDTDFPDVDREKVIDYVKDKYGEYNVAGIITFGTLKAKQAVRDVGRVLNIPLTDIDYICKKLGFASLRDLKKADKEISNFIDNDSKLKLLYNVVSLIENNKRHTSVHAAGIVISYKKLDDVLPIIKNDDIYLTEYTMEYLEEIGLIKMDFLGIRNLAIIKNIINDVKEDLGINIDFNNIPLDDKKVIYLFECADTVGVFQFESDGMKRFLKDMKPKTFEDICAAIALFRPGPAVNIPLFIKRKEGKEKIDYYDDRLKPILESTYGVLVYQEQIMRIANVMASYSLGEADILRKAMSKKNYDILKREEEKFINNSIKNGYDSKVSKEMFDLILNFANYGFNKSHSVSYSLVAYKMAYLKCYYPKYFYSNIISSVIGSEIKTTEYLNEVKKLNIKILPPDINLSYQDKYRVDENGIRLPLSSIRNVGGVISSFIVQDREKKEFSDIYDFLKRTFSKTNNRKILESLIYAHAFASFNLNINTLLNNIDSIINYCELSLDLEDDVVSVPELTYYDEVDIDTLLEKEKELFGFYVTSHKTEKYKLLDKNVINLNDINKMLGKNVAIIVNIEKIKIIKTKRNEDMAFISGSDNSGEISITVFPILYQEIVTLDLKKGIVVKIKGTVEKRFNEYQVIAKEISKI